jgi:iron complex outermembrane recepter protein
MFKKTKICTALAAACGGALLVTALPAVAQTPQRIEITGSSIKRVDTEGALPVQIIKREDIERQGATTLTEVVNNLTSASGGTFTEAQSAGNSFAPGTAGTSLRGLGTNATLTLINGRRMANYGFSQNLDEAFVDLNSIPLSAIERIEILKDGASAIYGSDALAGVVNIILRKDFRGVEVNAFMGDTQNGGAGDRGGSISVGFGDITTQKFNVFGVLSVYDRDELNAGDRSFSNNPDQRAKGGFDFRSPTGSPGVWRTGGRGTDPATGQPYADNTVFPDCPASSIDVFSDGYTTCYYNFASDNWLLPKTNRVGLYLRGTAALGANLTAFAEVGLNKNTTNQSAAPSPDGFNLPVGHVSNPYNFVVPIRFRWNQVGPRLNEIETDASRVVLGLTGSHIGWDWDAGLLSTESETTNTGTNYLSAQARQAALPVFDFVNPANNSAADLAALRISPVRVGKSTLKSFDFKASRPLFAMAGGDAALALGFDMRKETLTDTPDANTLAGNVVGSGGTSSKGERDSKAVFAEMSLPLMKGLEAQLALRHDRYSDFGSATTPKVAVSWKPNNTILVRGSVAKGFRAPSLVQLYLGRSTSFPSFVDVIRCDAYNAALASGVVTQAQRNSACASPQVFSESIGNPNLDAEKSTSYSIGVVLEPIRDLSIGIDLWKIDHTNKIDTLTSAYTLRNADALSAALGRPVVNRFDPSATDLLVGTVGAIRGTGSDNTVGRVSTYFNAQTQQTSGVDIDARYRTNLAGIGRLGLGTVITYMDTFKRELNPGAGLQELAGTWGYPRMRARTVATLDSGSWQFTLANNYTGRYEQFYQAGPLKVKENITFDAQVQYTGFKNLKLTVGGRNIFNENPPWADENYYGYDSSNTDPRGAYWYARVGYTF